MMFLKVIHSFFLSVRGLFRDIKSDIKTSKEHFTVNIKQNKAKDYLLDLTREYHKEYKYEIAVCHKRYNEGAWIILYRGNDYKKSVKMFNRLWLKLKHIDRKVLLKCIASGVTYQWSDEPAIYYWDSEEEENGRD